MTTARPAAKSFCHKAQNLNRPLPKLPFSLKGVFEFLKTTCVEPYRPCRAKALATAGRKNSEIFRGFGFSLMPDGCDNLLQLPYLVMFAACAVFS